MCFSYKLYYIILVHFLKLCVKCIVRHIISSNRKGGFYLKTEIELLQYLESNSFKNILKFSYEEFLNEVNKGNVSISNYLYGKLFFEKAKESNSSII